MQFPKKVKHRKWHSDRSNPKKRFVATRGTKLSFGSFGLKATSSIRVMSNQIEAARKVLRRSMGKTGRLWIRIFPDRPVTQKGAETPMGKGKGEPKGYCFQVEEGRIIFEVDGVVEATAREALRKAGAKLPISTRVVSRNIV